MTSILAVFNCGHSIVLADIELWPDEYVPFPREKALRTGTGHISGLCPHCHEDSKKVAFN